VTEQPDFHCLESRERGFINRERGFINRERAGIS